jgi:hypothetical protein
MVLVERRSQREVALLTGLARDTVARAVRAEVPSRYVRAAAGSKLDPFKVWICEQLRAYPSMQSLRLREMATEPGYAGGKSISDDYVREVRPRFLAPRTFRRTIYRPGELVQCDLWEPTEHVPVGHGQLRRGWVVTAEVCWSRVIAGALTFSKEAPDILWGLGRCLERLGCCRRRWCGTARARSQGMAGRRRVRRVLVASSASVRIILDAGDPQANALVSYRPFPGVPDWGILSRLREQNHDRGGGRER